MINVALYEKAFVDSQSKIDRIVSRAGVKCDMKILSTLLYGQLGLIMPLAGSLSTVGTRVRVFFSIAPC